MEQVRKQQVQSNPLALLFGAYFIWMSWGMAFKVLPEVTLTSVIVGLAVLGLMVPIVRLLQLVKPLRRSMWTIAPELAEGISRQSRDQSPPRWEQWAWTIILVVLIPPLYALPVWQVRPGGIGSWWGLAFCVFAAGVLFVVSAKLSWVVLAPLSQAAFIGLAHLLGGPVAMSASFVTGLGLALYCLWASVRALRSSPATAD